MNSKNNPNKKNIINIPIDDLNLSIDDIIEMSESDTTAESAYSRGIFVMKNNKYEEAIKEFTKAINLGKIDSDIYGQRAMCFLNLGKLDSAINDFSLGIEKINIADNKMKAILLSLRGKAYFQQKKIEEALIDLNESIELYPTKAFETRCNLFYTQ